jgi:hypothetical protein
MTRPLAEVYREAAWLVESGATGYSCFAISDALGVMRWGRRAAHKKFMAIWGHNEYWLATEIWRAHQDLECDCRDLRVMLLCLAAALAEAGDLGPWE